MKKNILISIIFYLFFGILAHAQENIDKDLKLKDPLATKTYNYKASNSISFLPGFNFKATGSNYLYASINTYNLSPNPYPNNILGGISNGVVGKIDDEFTVTPAGQASYEIPITVPAGTGGMTPQLSIVYNSSSKEGLLGYGFDLSGLSLINRTPQNYHVDGRVTAVDFSVNDRFMLDGQRLIRISPSTQTQNIEYRTENNTFSKIVAKGSQSDPEEFTVYTKSGLTYVYRSNRLSLKSTDGGTVDNTLFWFLKKVTDTKGNYYEISYDKEVKVGEFSEYWPIRIDYTGNANLSPYASIRFNYTDIDPSYTYIYGAAVRKSKLMKSIEIYSGENKRIKYYDLSYKKNLNANLLESVTEVASDGKKLNPTKLDWNIMTDYSIKTLTSGERTGDFDNYSVAIGDFDGDGRSDFLTWKNNSNTYRINLRDTSNETNAFNTSNYNNVRTFSNTKEVLELYTGDFNGDGKIDVIVTSVANKRYNWDLYLANDIGGFTYSKTFASSDNSNYLKITRVGDFDGDGFDDVLINFQTGARTETTSIYFGKRYDPLIKSSNSVFPEGSRDPHLQFIRDINVLDVNGDGLSDIVTYSSTTMDVYINKNKFTDLPIDIKCSFEKTNVIKNWFQPYVSIESKDYIIGDFNGDGKPDILNYNKGVSLGSNNFWSIRYGNGKGFDEPEKLKFQFDNFDANNFDVYTGDFNGDGLTDLFFVFNNTNKNVVRPKYYSLLQINNLDGKSFTEKIGFDQPDDLTIKKNYYLADFNGDGKSGILEYSNKDKPGYRLHVMSDEKNNMLKSIRDGLGNLTEISYKPLTDNTVYTKMSSGVYPLPIIRPSWIVVDRISKNNGIGGKFEKTYQYRNLHLHKLGRGILGFEYFIEKDLTTNTEVISWFEIDPKELVTALKETTVQVGNKFVSKTSNINKLRYYQDKVYTYDVVNTIEQKFDLNTGNEYSSISTRSVFDDYGNITRSVIKYSANDSVINENKYEKDNISKWYLGRLSESTVTKVNPKGTVKRISRFDYDPASGLLIKEEVEPGNVDLGYVKTYVHDKFGNITSSTTTSNNPKYKPRTKTSIYDSQGRFEEQSIDNLGFVIKRTIDKDLGLVKTETDPNGLTTEYIYDSFGRTEYSKTPLGNSHSLVLWSKGHPDAPANAVYFTYNEVSGSPATIEFFDGLGRSLRKKAIGFDGTAIYVDALYNAKGEQYKSSEPYFPGNTVYWNQSEYDAIGRVTKQIYPDNTYHSYTYDGLKTVTTSPLGLKDTKRIDVKGNIVESIDNLNGKVTYGYNASGNCESVVGPRTTMTAKFDLLGNRIKFEDPDLGTTESLYNAYGELVWSKDPNENITTIEYDGLGRVLKENIAEGTTQYVYDTLWKGSVTSVTSPKYVQKFAYDKYGRATTITEIIDGKSYSTNTSFDKFSRIDKVTYPTGFTVKHTYNSNGFLSQIVNNQTGQQYWAAQKTNARGQLEQFKLGNGLTTTTTYNPQKGYITNIKTPGIQDWSYSFNADGNLDSRKDNTRNMTEKFDYDGLNRLWKTYHNGTLKEMVSYDAAGNITSKTGVGTKFEYYPGTNRLKSVSGGSYSPPNWDITYTSFNKISQVLQGEIGKSNYASLNILYGADKQRKRAKQTKDGKTDTRYYVGALFEENELSTGEVKKIHHIFANGTAIAIFEQSTLRGESTMYLHRDHLGSVQAYSDKSGKLTQELSYDAWGRRRNPANWTFYASIVDAKPLYERGFTGHEHLDMFEMINMNGRMYDPILGRFLSPDPYVQAPDFTQGLNRYIYVLNNPLSLVDPSGYSWFSKNWKSLTASIVGIAVGTFVPGGGGFFVAAVIKGALGGAASGLAGALLNGANIGQIAKSTVVGGFWGGATAASSLGVGMNMRGINPLLKMFVGNSVSQGILTTAQGGKFKHGFLSGLVASGGAYGTRLTGITNANLGMIINSVVGGTASELGGGNFANGAITSAFTSLFYTASNKTKKLAQKGVENCILACTEGALTELGGPVIKEETFSSYIDHAGSIEANDWIQKFGVVVDDKFEAFLLNNNYSNLQKISKFVDNINYQVLVFYVSDNINSGHASTISSIYLSSKDIQGKYSLGMSIMDPASRGSQVKINFWGPSFQAVSAYRTMSNKETNSIMGFGIIHRK